MSLYGRVNISGMKNADSAARLPVVNNPDPFNACLRPAKSVQMLTESVSLAQRSRQIGKTGGDCRHSRSPTGAGGFLRR